jgi:hypothetical protein
MVKAFTQPTHDLIRPNGNRDARRKSALTRLIQVWMAAIAVRVALQLHAKISAWIRDAAFHLAPMNA